jgi:hypothetical protein
VRADDDGHLVQRTVGVTTIHLPAGAYWLANGGEFGCVVKVT